MKFSTVQAENAYLKKEVARLIQLCKEKDTYFLQLMSNGLRCGSKLAAKHMSDRYKYLQGK